MSRTSAWILFVTMLVVGCASSGAGAGVDASNQTDGVLSAADADAGTNDAVADSAQQLDVANDIEAVDVFSIDSVLNDSVADAVLIDSPATDAQAGSGCGPLEHECLCAGGSYCLASNAMCISPDSPCPGSKDVTSDAACPQGQYSCPCATGSYCLFIGAMCISPSSPCPADAQSSDVAQPNDTATDSIDATMSGGQPGDLCGEPGEATCSTSLVCCYPCGIPGCHNKCAVPCSDSWCSGGCPMLP